MAAPAIPAADAGLSADEALRSILRRLAATIETLHGDLEPDRDIEALHDFRVAVRRSRVAAGLLAKAGGKRGLKRFRRDLKWLGEVTGTCRDLDVMLDGFEQFDAFVRGEEGALAAIRELMISARSEARRQMLVALGSPRFSQFQVAWPERLGTECPGTPAVGQFAARRIDKAHRRVVRRAAGVGGDPNALHRVRIDCKRLRYHLEFFRRIHLPESTRDQIATLKKLQDVLGHHHDLYVQEQRFADLAECAAASASDLGTLRRLCRALAAQRDEVAVEALAALERFG